MFYFKNLFLSKGACYGYYSSDHLSSLASGITAGLALQPPVGLLRKWPAGTSPVDRHNRLTPGLVLADKNDL